MSDATPAPCTRALKAGPAWICTCGRSADGLFCDGSHKGSGFVPLKVEVAEDRELTYQGRSLA